MMIGTKGTERQVKFAQDILAKINEVASVNAVIEEIKEEVMKNDRKDEDWKKGRITKIENAMQEAKFIIESLQDYFYELRNFPNVTEKLGKNYAMHKIADGLKEHNSIAKYAKRVAKRYLDKVDFNV